MSSADSFLPFPNPPDKSKPRRGHVDRAGRGLFLQKFLYRSFDNLSLDGPLGVALFPKRRREVFRHTDGNHVVGLLIVSRLYRRRGLSLSLAFFHVSASSR